MKAFSGNPSTKLIERTEKLIKMRTEPDLWPPKVKKNRNFSEITWAQIWGMGSISSGIFFSEHENVNYYYDDAIRPIFFIVHLAFDMLKHFMILFYLSFLMRIFFVFLNRTLLTQNNKIQSPWKCNGNAMYALRIYRLSMTRYVSTSIKSDKIPKEISK